MIVIHPTHAGDIAASKHLAKWLVKLHGETQTGRKFVVIADKNVHSHDLDLLRHHLSKVFDVTILTTKESVSGWIAGSSYMFSVAARLARKMGQPWFWLEPDCTPLKSDWWEQLEASYDAAVKAGKHFVGARVETPKPHLTGTAIYPANINAYADNMINPPRNVPFDLYKAAEVLRNSFITYKIQHSWKGNVSDPRQLDPRAVVYHGHKGPELIDMLSAYEVTKLKKETITYKVKKDSEESIEDAPKEQIQLLPLHIVELPSWAKDEKLAHKLVITRSDSELRMKWNAEKKQWVNSRSNAAKRRHVDVDEEEGWKTVEVRPVSY